MKRKEWFVIYPIAARHRAVVVRILGMMGMVNTRSVFVASVMQGLVDGVHQPTDRGGNDSERNIRNIGKPAHGA